MKTAVGGKRVASYDDPSLRGQGASTPSQSAWALLGLCAFRQVNRKSVERAVRYLVSTQNPDGSWSETLITGTGFPRVFYLKYDMYRNNWPLMALARYALAKFRRIGPNPDMLSENAERSGRNQELAAEHRKQRFLR